MKKIDLVIKSYKKKSSKKDEILIQKMVSEVKYSGVYSLEILIVIILIM